MNNNNETIPAIHVAEIKRGLQRLNIEAERLNIETQQLEVQKGEMRRVLLLLAIEHCADANAVREFWKKLDPEEQQDHEIVNKFLYYHDGQYVGEIFGNNPWLNTNFPDWPRLPESFTTDRNAFLIFLEKGLFKPILPSQLRGYHIEFCEDVEYIPGIMLDDTEVMMAVCAKCPLRFQHASERLQDDEDFVGWMLRGCNSSERECNAFYVSERLQQKLLLDGAQVPAIDFPDDFQASQEDIIAFLKYGHGVYYLKNLAGHVPDDLKNDKDCMLHVIANCNGSIQDINTGFHSDLLSERLQKDEDIVKALLQAGYSDCIEILRNAPSLLESAEVMMLLLSVEYNRTYHDHPSFGDLVHQCRLLDDDDFMLEAYKRDCGTFCYASDRLRSNRDFLDRLLDATQKCNFLQATTDAFNAENTDFIVSVINRARHNDDDDDDKWFLEQRGQAFWNNKQAVMACLQQGWLVWEFIERNSPFFRTRKSFSFPS